MEQLEALRAKVRESIETLRDDVGSLIEAEPIDGIENLCDQLFPDRIPLSEKSALFSLINSAVVLLTLGARRQLAQEEHIYVTS